MRTTVSMPPRLFLAAIERQRKLALATFSDYFQMLVRRDAMSDNEQVTSSA